MIILHETYIEKIFSKFCKYLEQKNYGNFLNIFYEFFKK